MLDIDVEIDKGIWSVAKHVLSVVNVIGYWV